MMNNLLIPKINLQFFAEAVKGKNQILLFRLLSEQGTASATKLAFQTEHENTKTKDSEAVQTKDGAIRTTSGTEVEMSATSILSVDDELVTKLEDALDNDQLIEIWEVDITKKTTGGKYPATYFQAYVTSFGKTPNAEDSVELSLEFGVNGSGVKGEATLTAEQEAVVQYEFTDTTPVVGE